MTTLSEDYKNKRCNSELTLNLTSELSCVIRRHPFNVVEEMDYESRRTKAVEVDRGL